MNRRYALLWSAACLAPVPGCVAERLADMEVDEGALAASAAGLIGPDVTEVLVYGNPDHADGLAAEVPVVVSFKDGKPDVAFRIACGSNHGSLLHGFGYPRTLSLSEAAFYDSFDQLRAELDHRRGAEVPVRTLSCNADPELTRRQILQVYRRTDADLEKQEAEYYLRLRDDPGTIYSVGCLNLLTALAWTPSGPSLSEQSVPINQDVLKTWRDQQVDTRQINCFLSTAQPLPPAPRELPTPSASDGLRHEAALFKVRYSFDGIASRTVPYLISGGKGYAIDCGLNWATLVQALGFSPDAPLEELSTSDPRFVGSGPGRQPHLRCRDDGATLVEGADPGPTNLHFQLNGKKALVHFACPSAASFFRRAATNVRVVPAAAMPYLFPDPNAPNDPSPMLEIGCNGLSDAELQDGEFALRSVHSGKCLDVPAASTVNGARLQQWDCNGTGAQRFRFTSRGDGIYTITNTNSGKVLDVLDVRMDRGAPLQQWDDWGVAEQRFRLTWLAHDELTLVAQHSGLALAVSGDSLQKGAPIVQWDPDGGAAQRWSLERVAGPAPIDGRITVEGRHVRVGGRPLQLRGVAWSPVPRGARSPDFAGFAGRDIPLMRAAGINTVRTYVPITDRSVLDQLDAAGIKVLMTVYAYGGDAPERAAAAVDAVKDHPAILMWLVGNEWNYNGLYLGRSHAWSLSRLNEVAALIRSRDADHPIATVYGEVPSADTIAAMPNIDVWGLNVYRGIGFGDLFSTWAGRSGKPMFAAEYGADAYNANIHASDLNSQAEAVRALTSELVRASVALHSDGVALGGTVFEWSDEWWKCEGSSNSPNAQDFCGISPGGGPYPDATFNEEWWGIVDIDRNVRPAYDALKQIYTSL